MQGLPGCVGRLHSVVFQEVGGGHDLALSGGFARGSGLTFGFESSAAYRPGWFCLSRGVIPVMAGTLPCGTNHVTASLDPPLPQG